MRAMVSGWIRSAVNRLRGIGQPRPWTAADDAYREEFDRQFDEMLAETVDSLEQANRPKRNFKLIA